MKGHFTPHTEETKRKISEAKKAAPTRHWLGKSFSDEHRRKLSLARLGKPPWNKGTAAPKEPPKPRVSPWKGKSNPHFVGDKNPNWRGGITPLHEKLRRSIEYKQWRRHVFQRDDYTCQACGVRGGNLQADHELPFSLFPELRHEILNGRTLCRPCHRLTPTYGDFRSIQRLYA